MPAICCLILASGSLILSIGSATTCQFLKISYAAQSPEDGFLGNDKGDGEGNVDTTSTGSGSYRDANVEADEGLDPNYDRYNIGIFCPSSVYPYREAQSNPDPMWTLVRYFFIASFCLSGMTALLSIALSTVLRPTYRNWKVLSVIAVLTAGLQIPVFLFYTISPCQGGGDDDTNANGGDEYGESTCSAGEGFFMLLWSALLLMTMTVLTQCFNYPRWREGMDEWKVKDRSLLQIYTYPYGNVDDPNFDRGDNENAPDDGRPRAFPSLFERPSRDTTADMENGQDQDNDLDFDEMNEIGNGNSPQTEEMKRIRDQSKGPSWYPLQSVRTKSKSKPKLSITHTKPPYNGNHLARHSYPTQQLKLNANGNTKKNASASPGRLSNLGRRMKRNRKNKQNEVDLHLLGDDNSDADVASQCLSGMSAQLLATFEGHSSHGLADLDSDASSEERDRERDLEYLQNTHAKTEDVMRRLRESESKQMQREIQMQSEGNAETEMETEALVEVKMEEVKKNSSQRGPKIVYNKGWGEKMRLKDEEYVTQQPVVVIKKTPKRSPTRRKFMKKGDENVSHLILADDDDDYKSTGPDGYDGVVQKSNAGLQLNDESAELYSSQEDEGSDEGVRRGLTDAVDGQSYDVHDIVCNSKEEDNESEFDDSVLSSPYSSGGQQLHVIDLHTGATELIVTEAVHDSSSRSSIVETSRKSSRTGADKLPGAHVVSDDESENTESSTDRNETGNKDAQEILEDLDKSDKSISNIQTDDSEMTDAYSSDQAKLRRKSKVVARKKDLEEGDEQKSKIVTGENLLDRSLTKIAELADIPEMDEPLHEDNSPRYHESGEWHDVLDVHGSEDDAQAFVKYQSADNFDDEKSHSLMMAALMRESEKKNSTSGKQIEADVTPVTNEYDQEAIKHTTAYSDSTSSCAVVSDDEDYSSRPVYALYPDEVEV